MKTPHIVARMGDCLRSEVERQLLRDLEHYRPGAAADDLTIDWSDPCQEGHCTEVLGGTLEEMSDLAVCKRDGTVVAAGWMDFVHGGGDLPLHVFWLFLDLTDRGAVKDDVAMPQHVWDALSESSRDACSVEGVYDARWKNDPKVEAWRVARRLTRRRS